MIDYSVVSYGEASKCLKACSAILGALDCIGSENESCDDHTLAGIVVENELELRDLVAYFLKRIRV